MENIGNFEELGDSIFFEVVDTLLDIGEALEVILQAV